MALVHEHLKIMHEMSCEHNRFARFYHNYAGSRSTGSVGGTTVASATVWSPPPPTEQLAAVATSPIEFTSYEMLLILQAYVDARLKNLVWDDGYAHSPVFLGGPYSIGGLASICKSWYVVIMQNYYALFRYTYDRLVALVESSPPDMISFHGALSLLHGGSRYRRTDTKFLAYETVKEICEHEIQLVRTDLKNACRKHLDHFHFPGELSGIVLDDAGAQTGLHLQLPSLWGFMLHVLEENQRNTGIQAMELHNKLLQLQEGLTANSLPEEIARCRDVLMTHLYEMEWNMMLDRQYPDMPTYEHYVHDIFLENRSLILDNFNKHVKIVPAKAPHEHLFAYQLPVHVRYLYMIGDHVHYVPGIVEECEAGSPPLFTCTVPTSQKRLLTYKNGHFFSLHYKYNPSVAFKLFLKSAHINFKCFVHCNISKTFMVPFSTGVVMYDWEASTMYSITRQNRPEVPRLRCTSDLLAIWWKHENHDQRFGAKERQQTAERFFSNLYITNKHQAMDRWTLVTMSMGMTKVNRRGRPHTLPKSAWKKARCDRVAI
tara:strand:- start:109 stop:1740 length:1632 start_codon:yes stop_codon:yes gene_type:complete